MRENGRWEVYSDFMLVYDFYDQAKQCVDIETDYQQFYLKFVKQSHLIESEVPIDQLELEVRMVKHEWRNRIRYDTMRQKKNPATWDIIIHKRIANYFKIYSQILNY